MNAPRKRKAEEPDPAPSSKKAADEVGEILAQLEGGVSQEERSTLLARLDDAFCKL